LGWNSLDSDYAIACGDFTLYLGSFDGDNGDDTITRRNHVGIAMLQIFLILTFYSIIPLAMIWHRILVYLKILIRGGFFNRYGVIFYEVLDNVLKPHAVYDFMSFDFVEVIEIILIELGWFL
jgi:hypothetical protein